MIILSFPSLEKDQICFWWQRVTGHPSLPMTPDLWMQDGILAIAAGAHDHMISSAIKLWHLCSRLQ
jgi:hypothetical protein